MAQDETPQIYLITPPDFELSRFPTQLASVLDTHEIACVRLALASHDEDTLCRAADALREVTMARDVALVIERHILLVERPLVVPFVTAILVDTLWTASGAGTTTDVLFHYLKCIFEFSKCGLRPVEE